MNAKPYHLEISARTKFLNFPRQFFILSGFEKFLAKYIKNDESFPFATKLIPPNYLYQPGKILNASTAKPVNEHTDYTNCHFDILCSPIL